MSEKKCSKCKEIKLIKNFGKLSSSPDGLKYNCKECIKKYNILNKEHITNKNKNYYENNKEILKLNNKLYREENKEQINNQRKEYRNRPNIKEHIKEKNKEYLPIKKEKIKMKRKTDKNFQISEILRSKINKVLKNKKTSYQKYIGCDVTFLKLWLEFRFDEFMNWDNLGTYWQIDHILPISRFDFSNEKNKYICFNWTNLQPLHKVENRIKTNKFELHYYFNNIININRFNKKYKQFLGYQAVNESLQWLRIELRYGKNAPDSYNSAELYKIGNPQPSL